MPKKASNQKIVKIIPRERIKLFDRDSTVLEVRAGGRYALSFGEILGSPVVRITRAKPQENDKNCLNVPLSALQSVLTEEDLGA